MSFDISLCFESGLSMLVERSGLDTQVTGAQVRSPHKESALRCRHSDCSLTARSYLNLNESSLPVAVKDLETCPQNTSSISKEEGKFFA